jgi:protein-S-isoprenylcysteine O-methyltransferase Ste14
MTKDTAGVAAPPPLIYLAGLAAGIGLDRLAAWPEMPPMVLPGLAAMALGIAVMALGIREFRKAGTDYHPHRPTTRIVTTGPFRFTRNPLYLSLTSIYAGIALALGSAWALLLLIPVLLAIRYGVIAREERYLAAKFGDEYLRYKDSVRRWL